MTTHIEATFEVASWDETPFDDSDEPAKLTEALVAKKYSGDIDRHVDDEMADGLRTG